MIFRWQDIPGFDDPSQYEYYAHIISIAPVGSSLVELGNYCGRGLCCLGLLAKEADKELNVYGVDWGQQMSGENVYPRMLEYIREAGLEGYVVCVKEDSVKAASFFRDDELWWVFLDGSHDREDVAADVKAWMPKVRKDGRLAGHDYRFHTVCEPIHALLDGVIHDPKWDNVWEAPKQTLHEGADIYERTQIPQPPRKS